jgi:hypothetical protein
MNKKEYTIVLTGLAEIYEEYQKVMKNEFLFETYYSHFEDIPLNLIQQIINIHQKQSPFPIKPANIREIFAELTTPEDARITVDESWKKVFKAISLYGYYRTQEVMESFDEITREVVSAIGWQNICTDENITATRAHFFKLFNNLQNKNKKQLVYSEQDKKRIADIREKYQLPKNILKKIKD